MLVVTYSLSQILKLKTEVYYSAGKGKSTRMRAHIGIKNLFPGGCYLKQGDAELWYWFVFIIIMDVFWSQ